MNLLTKDYLRNGESGMNRKRLMILLLAALVDNLLRGKKLFPMSHGDTNVGGDPKRQGTKTVSYADTLKGNKHASTNPIPLTKKCETIFRHESIPEGMNLHVKSATPHSIVFSLPRKDTRVDDIYLAIIRTYEYVDYFDCHTTQTSIQYSIAVEDPEHYNTIRKHEGITVNGRLYAPIVPTPTSVDLWRANFRHVPWFYNAKDFQRDFGAYGAIMEIGRYYRPLPLQQRKAYSGDGYILFDRSSSNKTFPPLPESIKVGGHIINTKMVDPDTNTAAKTGTGSKKPANITPPKQQQATNTSRAHQTKSKNNKRNGKKRLKTAVQEDLGPNGMEDVDTTPQKDLSISIRQQEVAVIEHQAESPTPATELQTDPPAPETQPGEKVATQDNGRNHALAPIGSGAPPGSTLTTPNPPHTLHSNNASMGSASVFFDARDSPCSKESDSESEQEPPTDDEGNAYPINNTNNNMSQQPAHPQRPKRNGYMGTYNEAQLSQASAKQSQQ